MAITKHNNIDNVNQPYEEEELEITAAASYNLDATYLINNKSSVTLTPYSKAGTHSLKIEASFIDHDNLADFEAADWKDFKEITGIDATGSPGDDQTVILPKLQGLTAIRYSTLKTSTGASDTIFVIYRAYG